MLLLVAAASFGVYFLAVMSVYGTIDQVHREAYAGSDTPDLGPVMAGASAIPALLLLGFGFVLLLLAWRTYRGGRAARGWTITLTLLTLCCCGSGTAFSRAAGDTVDSTDVDRIQTLVRQELAQALPSWFDLVTGAMIGIGLVALLVATGLLITRPSNRYFRLRGPIALHPYSYHPYRPR